MVEENIDDTVNNEHNKLKGQGSANQQAPKTDSIDDTLKEDKKQSELETKVDKSDKFTVGKFLWDAAKFAPYAYLIWRAVKGAFTPLMTIGGFILGNLYESWRRKKKVSYKGMRKDIKTAGFLGAGDYWFWTIPDIIPNFTLAGKIAKTLFAVPLLGMPYLYLYNHTLNLRETYIKLREKHGFLKTNAIFIPKLFSYIKDFHKQATKDSIKQMKQLLWIWPSYFLGFNFLTNIYHRIGVSVFNNMILRIITGKKKEPKYNKKADTQKTNYRTRPKYSPGYSPGY